MNASPILRMALARTTVPGRRLASHAVYPDTLPGPPPRRPPVTDPPPPDRLPLPLSGADAPGPAAGRRLLAHLPVRRLPALAWRPLPRDRPAGPAGLAAGERTSWSDAESAALADRLPRGLRRRRQRLAAVLSRCAATRPARPAPAAAPPFSAAAGAVAGTPTPCVRRTAGRRRCRSVSSAATGVASGAVTVGSGWCTPSGGSPRRAGTGCGRPTGRGSPSGPATGSCHSARPRPPTPPPPARLARVCQP